MLQIRIWLQDLPKDPRMDHHMDKAKVYLCLMLLLDFPNNSFKEFKLKWQSSCEWWQQLRRLQLRRQRLPLVLHREVHQIERRSSTSSFQNNLRCLLQETENKKWRNGEIGTAWSLKQYLTVIDNKFEDDIAYVERSNATEVDIDLLEDEERHRGRFLYSLLSSLLQGRLLSLVRNVDTSNGLEALRHLLENCQPRARNRTMSMLQSIMSYPNFVMKNSIMSQLVRLEEHFVQFEKMGGKLTDEMKSAVVLKCVSAPLKIHLNLSLNESSTYAQIREVIKAYDITQPLQSGQVA